jgi:alpha-ribazole phosphatase
MEIYLIRHTRPDVARGVCYGQSDIDVTESFYDEAAVIRSVLPPGIEAVHASPLQRCSKLAAHLFPGHVIEHDAALKEINCGDWELQEWDALPREALDVWMADFVNVAIPGGENYVQLYERNARCFERIAAKGQRAAIVAHGGVIRSILSYITQTPLRDSFGKFTIHYGCVVKLARTEDGFVYEVLSNIPHEQEKHKPSGY